MAEVQEQARKVADAAREVLESAWSSTQQTAHVARDHAEVAIDHALDGIFDEPYTVPDAQTARQLILDASAKRSTVLWSMAEGFLLARLVRLITRFSRFTVSSALIAAAPAVVSGVRHAVAGGLVQMRVLASFLASRARAEGVPLDKGLIRAAAVEVYLEPDHDVDFRYTGGRGGRATATRWAREALAKSKEHTQRELVDATDHRDRAARPSRSRTAVARGGSQRRLSPSPPRIGLERRRSDRAGWASWNTCPMRPWRPGSTRCVVRRRTRERSS